MRVLRGFVEFRFLPKFDISLRRGGKETALWGKWALPQVAPKCKFPCSRFICCSTLSSMQKAFHTCIRLFGKEGGSVLNQNSLCIFTINQIFVISDINRFCFLKKFDKLSLSL